MVSAVSAACALKATRAPVAGDSITAAAASLVISAVLAFSAPAPWSTITPVLETSKDGGREEVEEDGDDGEGRDKGERLEDLDTEALDGLVLVFARRGVQERVVPGRAILLQRSCWLGEQFKR